MNNDEGYEAADESRMPDEQPLCPWCVDRKILVGKFVSRTPALFWKRHKEHPKLTPGWQLMSTGATSTRNNKNVNFSKGNNVDFNVM